MFPEPGGCLQWDEEDSLNFHVKATNPSVLTDEIERLLQRLGGADKSAWALLDLTELVNLRMLQIAGNAP